MALFGSIGIGPVRVGASTRGRRSSGGVGGFAGFLVIFAIVMAFHYWYVVLPIIGFGLLLTAIAYIINIDGENRAEEAQRRAAIIKRAEEQHARLMDGDDSALYGNYPPADL